MLQFLTQPEEQYSIPEQCQMVIEGGCGWIQLHLPDTDEVYIRELANQLIPLCRESSAFLMLENRPELARELGLHGVHITFDSGLDAIKLREEFGPEAIIGVDVTSTDDIMKYQNADIDYLTLPASISDTSKSVIAMSAQQAGNRLPLVFQGSYYIADVLKPFMSNAAGVCTGAHILTAPDPAGYTQEFIKALSER
ncbi:MAG: thiamine phosphate synthase [Muribaculaceae bacterium]|nr:thiamine phosphate synthase [Muribaculaceae bacterium]